MERMYIAAKADYVLKSAAWALVAGDFAKMEGLKIWGVRGSDVRISRLEVKSGPQWLALY